MDMASNLTIEEIVEDMQRTFGGALPDPTTYPESFKYYLRVYRYYQAAAHKENVRKKFTQNNP